jgi:Fe-S oxidoreductase
MPPAPITCPYCEDVLSTVQKLGLHLYKLHKMELRNELKDMDEWQSFVACVADGTKAMFVKIYDEDDDSDDHLKKLYQCLGCSHCTVKFEVGKKHQKECKDSKRIITELLDGEPEEDEEPKSKGELRKQAQMKEMQAQKAKKAQIQNRADAEIRIMSELRLEAARLDEEGFDFGGRWSAALRARLTQMMEEPERYDVLIPGMKKSLLQMRIDAHGREIDGWIKDEFNIRFESEFPISIEEQERRERWNSHFCNDNNSFVPIPGMTIV